MGRITLAVLLYLPLSVYAQQQKAPKVDPAKVDNAINKGVAWLKSARPRGGGRHGMRELVLLALVHAGVKATDPVVVDLLKGMLDEPLESTYRVSLQAMVLEEIDRVKYQRRIWQCAQFLVDNQSENGQWSYGNPTTYSEPTVKIDPEPATPSFDKDKVVIFGEPEPTGKPAVKHKIPVKKQRAGGAGGDNSNSQYAMLGLRACHDAGIVLPKEVIDRATQWWRESQSGNGGSPGQKVPTGDGIPPAPPRGWSYGHQGQAYGSMTAGAIGALVICDYIQGVDWKKDANVNSGVNWLRDNFSVTENPVRKNQWHFYYLYGLERAGILYGFEKLGTHDWYPEGATFLIERQGADGSWGNPMDTCFAILFLKRATRPLVESRDIRK